MGSMQWSLILFESVVKSKKFSGVHALLRIITNSYQKKKKNIIVVQIELLNVFKYTYIGNSWRKPERT